ncbi:MAG: MFS transporter [Ignavibacteriaceae bacterium]
MTNPWKALKNIPHNMWVLFAATLINRSGTMVLPFFGLYLIQRLHISEGDAGFILASYGLGALITAPFVGKLSDYMGAMKVMKLSLLLTGGVMFIYPVFDGYNVLLLVTIIFAVISEAFRPANLAMIIEIVTPEQRKIAFALNRLGINLGMSIGPVAGGFLMMFDYSIIFYVNGVFCILAALFLIFSRWDKIPEEDIVLPEEPALSDGKRKTESFIKSIPLVKDKTLLFFVIIVLPLFMIFFQHLGTVPLFIVDYLGYTTATFGLLMAINTVMITFIEVPLNDAMSHWSDRKSLLLGAVLTGVGFGAMAFVHGITGLVITIIIWTFGEMIVFPSSANYVAEIAPRDKRGVYMGFYQMTFSMAFTIGPLLGTQVYEHYGPVVLWLSAFALSLVSIVLLIKLPEKKIAASHTNPLRGKEGV